MAAVEEPVLDEPIDEMEDVAVEEEEEEDFVEVGAATEVKLFGKWAFDDIEVRDISLVVRKWGRREGKCGKAALILTFLALTSFPLHIFLSDRQDYIACKGDHATYLPHTAGRYAKKRFRKASCPIVERLACCLMRKGRNAGKKLQAVRIIQHTLEIIHLLTDQNPIQVVVDAIINSGPREDSTRVGGAGVVRRQAVDMSPFRRVNYALYLLATGAREASFRNLKTMAECLAEELINAARGSSNSYAIKKKDEIERVSKSNR
jgi:small subunit ribosomal protein S5e